MRHIACSLLIGNLVLGGMVLPAEAGGRRHKHYRHRVHHGHHHRRHVYRHDHHYGPGHFVGGFLAGAATVLVVNSLHTPRVVYTHPVAYRPAPYRAPVCQNIWVPGEWELRPRHDNGFTTYYHVWVEGRWQQHCG